MVPRHYKNHFRNMGDIMKTRVAARTTNIVGAVIFFCSLTAAPALAEEAKPTANASVGVFSQYIWRGWELSRDSIVIQPSMTVAYNGLAVNLWGNLDTNYYNPDPALETNDFNETDLTISYDGSAGKLLYGVGYIYYATTADTQEVYAKVGIDTLLKPTLTVYRDIDHIAGWYIQAGVSHSLPITGKTTLDLGARAGYYISATDSFTEANSSEKYSAFHDGVLSAALTIPVGQYLTVSPQLSWSFPLSSKAKDRLEADNLALLGEEKSSFFFGGIATTFAF